MKSIDLARRLLLISNSTLHGGGYLDHAEEEIRNFVGEAAKTIFVPFAVHDWGIYAAKAQERCRDMGFSLTSIHDLSNMPRAIDEADVIFIGGGNTFRLLNGLYNHDLLGPIRRRIRAGMPYIGSSAGSIVAGPTLKTTKDMPIVEPASFEALALVGFQISPHYLDPDPTSRHMGETQEERISQFLEENDAPVVGLREGAFLRVDGESVFLGGESAARIFRRGRAAVEAQPGGRIDSLIREDRQ